MAPDASGDVRGVCGLRKARDRGELGADEGVSGRRRIELDEARDEGRDIGRRVGVTPVRSPLCLCMRSRTCCSSFEGKKIV